MNRREAIASGAKTYTPRRQCKNGSVAERYVSNGHCKCRECAKETSARYCASLKKDPVAANARVKDWQRRNPERVAAIRERGKERRSVARKAWATNNRGQVRANVVRYKAAKMGACPAWADIAAIREIYRTAAEMRAAGEDVHVDHIHPLRSKTSCGLHVDYNLRIIPARENLSKGNSLTTCQRLLAQPEK